MSGVYGVRREVYFGRSGRAGRPIVYRSHRAPARIRWTGGRTSVVGIAIFKVGNGTHDLRFEGLHFDGANETTQCVKVNRGGHHVTIVGNRLSNCAGSGIATKGADHVTVARNLIHHTGYADGHGWGSGISLNSHVWSDGAPGFHSYVVGNVISGASDESPHHSEGSGVIIDLGGDAPPVLVANNVAYQNGDHCVHVLDVSNVWVVNNTCYMNGLDRRQGPTGEISVSRPGAANVRVINNVARAWTGRPPFQQLNDARVSFAGNGEHGDTRSAVPEGVLGDPRQLRRSDPRFVDPTAVDPRADQQQRTALPPWRLGDRLTPSRDSLVDGGVDPLATSGLTPELRSGMRRYVAKDITGAPRPRGRWDVGAYE